MIQCLCGGFGDFQLGSQADPSLESLISVNSNLYLSLQLLTCAHLLLTCDRLVGSNFVRVLGYLRPVFAISLRFLEQITSDLYFRLSTRV